MKQIKLFDIDDVYSKSRKRSDIEEKYGNSEIVVVQRRRS